MSLYEKTSAARKNKDIDGYASLLHEDFRFISHQDGSTMDKQAFVDKTARLMASDSMKIQDQRLIYENDDIMVSFTLVDFPDETTEAVIAVNKLEDGKIIEMETGATLVTR